MSRIRVIELYAGIGGFRYGIEQVDSSFHFVYANDFNKYACAVYRKQYGEINEGNIRTIDPATIPDHDLICAGFPCQSFSIAGKRGGFEDTRGTLFFEICRIARVKRTPYLFLENVKGLLNHDEGNTFQTILGTLDELGYDCQWEVFNSKDYGVPQNRERVFIIGHLRGERRPQVFPIGETTCEDIGCTERSIVTGTVKPGWGQKQNDATYLVVQAIDANYAKDNCGFSGIKRATVMTEAVIETDYSNDKGFNGTNYRPRHRVLSDKGIGRAVSTVENQMPFIIHNAYPDKNREYKEYSPTISTPSGGGHLPVVVQPILTPTRDQARQRGRRMKNDGESMFTLTGQDIHGVAIANCVTPDAYLARGERNRDKDGNAVLTSMNDRRIRRLTPIECERLQGFPDNWTKYGIDKDGKEIEISDTQRYKCCGNAVTTNMITAIGVKLLSELNK
jgi:DNA (cytosine-5)-methyltransferase 1